MNPVPPPDRAGLSQEMHTSQLSRLLVAGQLLLLAGLAITSAWPSMWQWGLMAAGVGLGGWALATMPLRQLRLVPDVHPQGRLIHGGPYRRIRHPMYAAVLWFSLGMVATSPIPGRLAMEMALVVIMIVKLNREERLLLAAYPEYAAYQAATWRLVPWIW